MAADKWLDEAMYNYGIMLKTGDGIPIDERESDIYLTMAESSK